ncbi:MAG TPA: hypothetical protein VNA19_06345 [Pyrinomonadaceae bacterium]|jgi:hypothetical protein|nr:hypothetical protein [Pyrinomonadaceae bacterium]
MPFTRPNSLNLCESCWPFDYDPKLFLERLEQDTEEERNLRKALDIPADAITKTVPISGACINEQLRAYEFEMFGIVISPIPAEELLGYLILPTSEDNIQMDWLMQVWRQKVKHDATNFYGEVRWHPKSGERIAIKGLEHAGSKADIELIWTGLRLLNQVREKIRRGRPIGSRMLTPKRFVNASIKAYRESLSNHNKYPTQHDIFTSLYIPRATFYRYMKGYGITWKWIREKALKDKN